MNSWEKSLFGVGAGVGTGALGAEAGCLRADFLLQAGGMVENRAESGDEKKEGGFSSLSKQASYTVGWELLEL